MITPQPNDKRFKKYCSIDNHNHAKIISKWETHFPELTITSHIVEEKLDGSCFGICITEDSIDYSSRRKILEDTDGFNNYMSVMSRYQDYLDKLQEYVRSTDTVNSIRIYGELYGRVFTRVDYGDADNDFKPFDVLVNDKFLTKKDAHELLKSLDIFDWWVPVLGIFDTFKEALDFEVEGVETEVSLGERRKDTCNFIEGVVITPYDTIFSYDQPDGNQSIFKIKKKSKKFKDKDNSKTKKEFVPFEGSDEYVRLATIWEGLINENRLLDLFSKEGMIESPKEIGKYIPLMLADVKEDFFKEHKDDFIKLDDKEKKKIISSTAGCVVPLLHKHL